MKSFKPNMPYNVPMHYLEPRKSSSLGTNKKAWTKPSKNNLFLCSFKTFGGTERVVNGQLVIEDTAVVETWYNDKITNECRVKDESGNVYEIISTPENIDMRNQFMQFKIRRHRGGA